MVGHLLPFAATAETKMLADRLHALFGHLLEVQYFALKEVFLALVDFNVNHIAGHAKRNEDHAPFRLGHRHAL